MNHIQFSQKLIAAFYGKISKNDLAELKGWWSLRCSDDDFLRSVFQDVAKYHKETKGRKATRTEPSSWDMLVSVQVRYGMPTKHN